MWNPPSSEFLRSWQFIVGCESHRAVLRSSAVAPTLYVEKGSPGICCAECTEWQNMPVYLYQLFNAVHCVKELSGAVCVPLPRLIAWVVLRACEAASWHLRMVKHGVCSSMQISVSMNNGSFVADIRRSKSPTKNNRSEVASAVVRYMRCRKRKSLEDPAPRHVA
jgi:hypothetical protein